MPRVIYVRADLASHTRQADVRGDDRNVAGLYEVEIDDSVPEKFLATAALDGFHSMVPVKCIDDFEFRVVDKEGHDLPSQEGADSYRFSSNAKVLDRHPLPKQRRQPRGERP